MRVLAVNHVSLDVVLQGPGRSDEDTRDGLRHGGWAQQATDPATAIGARIGREFSWLFGRRSYEDMLAQVDELFLMIHPLVLGSGRRLFGPGVEAYPLRLVDCTPTASGVLMATYQPAHLAS
jgi:hypothetical protein